jgi:hypothetical protein
VMFGITPNQATLLGAFGGATLGAVIGGLVSFIVARYTVKHSANYSGQIETINHALSSLAATQEEMKQHYAQSVADEKKRHEENERRAEAAQWKPQARIESKVEGVEQVNKLILKDQANFYLTEVSLISLAGAKLVDYSVMAGVSTTGFSVPITHASLNKITANNQQFFNTETFSGAIRYTARREKDGASYTGEIQFHGERVYLNSTCFYKLTG